MTIERLPWAGIKIESNGTTLFIDAAANSRWNDPPLKADTPVVHAVITHHHHDHFDPTALKGVLNENSILYCGSESLRWIDSRQFRTVAVPTYQPVDVSAWTGDLVAIPVPALDGFGHPQVSWIIRSGGKTIIHCGDTQWHGYWRDISLAYGPFDLAFLPINAARISKGLVKDTGIPAIMNPEQAVVAAQLLRAKVACPIHYGRPTESYFETDKPEETFIEHAKRRGVNYEITKPGDLISLE